MNWKGIVYSVYAEDAEHHAVYFATKGEAIKEAQESADFHGHDIEVLRHRVAKLPYRELLIALLNFSGWSAEQELVHIASPSARGDQ